MGGVVSRHAVHHHHHHHTELTPARLARLDARVDAALTASPAVGGRGLGALRLGLVVLVAALVSSTWVLARGTGAADPGRPLAPAPTAAELAARAARLPAPPVGAGYAHLHVAEQGIGRARWREQRWVAADGSGMVVHLPLTESGQAGTPEVRVAGPGELRTGGLTPPQVGALHGTPDQVFAQLQRDAGPGTAPETYIVGLVELLAWPGVPARTRAILFRVLDELGYRSQATAEPGLVLLVGPGPDPGDVTTVTVDLATTRPTRYATVGDRPPGDLDHVVTFLDAYRTDTLP